MRRLWWCLAVSLVTGLALAEVYNMPGRPRTIASDVTITDDFTSNSGLWTADYGDNWTWSAGTEWEENDVSDPSASYGPMLRNTTALAGTNQWAVTQIKARDVAKSYGAGLMLRANGTGTGERYMVYFVGAVSGSIRWHKVTASAITSPVTAAAGTRVEGTHADSDCTFLERNPDPPGTGSFCDELNDFIGVKLQGTGASTTVKVYCFESTDSATALDLASWDDGTDLACTLTVNPSWTTFVDSGNYIGIGHYKSNAYGYVDYETFKGGDQ